MGLVTILVSVVEDDAEMIESGAWMGRYKQGAVLTLVPLLVVSIK